jgi:hypothetical protein
MEAIAGLGIKMLFMQAPATNIFLKPKVDIIIRPNENLDREPANPSEIIGV